MANTGSIISLLILLILVAILAAIGFVTYTIAHDVGHKTRQKLEKKNVSFSRDGVKVGVKHVTIEQQEDAAQSVITKIWNNSSWPAYQSRLGWAQAKPVTPGSTPSAEKRNPVPTLSRHGSSQSNLSRSTSAQVNPPPRTTSTQGVKKA